jgi:DNA-binding cell septation regulator SpoVG
VRGILLQAITVLITVLSIKPVKFGQIFALASVEIDIDGVVHGIRAMRGQPMGTRVDLPVFRDANDRNGASADQTVGVAPSRS